MQRDGKTLGRRRVAQPRARRRAHVVHHLPLVVGHQLLRLSPVADGQPEARRAAQRDQDHAQLDVVQLPGAARRRLHARQGQHGDARPHLAGAIVERGRGQLAGSEPPDDLRPAADGVGRRLRRSGVQHPRAAHRARDRNQDLHRLPRLGQRRQQRGDVAAAAARHQLRQLHRPLRLCRHRPRRRRSGRGDRDRRAAGGDRQRPSQARVPGALRRAPEARASS